MRTRSITAVALAGFLALSGCSGSASDDSEQSQSESSQSQSPEASDPSPSRQAPTEDSNDPDEGSEESGADDPESPAPSEDSELTLDTGGKTVTIEPTDVYCSGKPGSLQHIIGKTDDELPLVKAEGTDFVMVKVGEGRPYKTNSPKGVNVGDESVTFDGTELGSATLDGTMTCTDWED